MLEKVYDTEAKFTKARQVAIREIQDVQPKGRTYRKIEMLYFLAGYFHREGLDLYTALEVVEDISSLLRD